MTPTLTTGIIQTSRAGPCQNGSRGRDFFVPKYGVGKDLQRKVFFHTPLTSGTNSVQWEHDKSTTHYLSGILAAPRYRVPL